MTENLHRLLENTGTANPTEERNTVGREAQKTPTDHVKESCTRCFEFQPLLFPDFIFKIYFMKMSVGKLPC